MIVKNIGKLDKVSCHKVRYVYTQNHLRNSINNGLNIFNNKKFTILPDFLTVYYQFDLFERKEFFSKVRIILLGSILEQIQEDNIRLANRIGRIFLKFNFVHIFFNQHCTSTFIQKKKGENTNKHQERLFLKACFWYSQENKRFPKIKLSFITNKDSFKMLFFERSLEIITIKQFIYKYFPKLKCVYKKTEDETIRKYKDIHFIYSLHWSIEDSQKSVNNGTLLKGKLDVKFWGIDGFATVRTDKTKNLILIKGWENINRAIHGDIVALVIWEENNKQLGKVVCILKKSRRQCCGTLEETKQDNDWALFVPLNKKIPKIRIKIKHIQTFVNHRIVVAIDNWSSRSAYPQGHFIKSLGLIGNIEVETKVLLIENDVPHETWSYEVLSCLPSNTNLSKKEYKNRLDLTKKFIYSIDPLNCQDIDDALHCELLSNGNYECGVHIADVSFYVKLNTPLDLEAKKRGTSVYLVDRRIDMLPQLLSSNLCSLQPNVDRLAFSVIWELTSEAEIIDTIFARTVINNKIKFSYVDAQKRIDKRFPRDSITKSINNLNKIAKILRKKRLQYGALSLESPSPKFILNKKKEPINFKCYEIFQANNLIEEFMILTNVTVAKHILTYFPKNSILRRHPVPNENIMENFIKSTEIKGFRIRVENNKLLNDSLNRCNTSDCEVFNKCIRIIAIKYMSQALYFNSGKEEPYDYYHYGLAIPIYTHFTSPIRRYADIIVHRQLANTTVKNSKINLKNIGSIDEICDIINKRHKLSQYITRDSNRLYVLKYFMNKRVKTDAIITNVNKNFLEIYIPAYAMHEIVNVVTNKDINKWIFSEKLLTLERFIFPIKLFTVFDPIKVEISVKKNKQKYKLVISILNSTSNETPKKKYRV